MFTIGEFSRITGLSIKALRLYHDRELLVPAQTDPASGYRIYSDADVERAKVIRTLRDLEFGLDDIQAMLTDYDDDASLVSFLEARQQEITLRRTHLKHISRELTHIIQQEKEIAMTLQSNEFDVETKTLNTELIASIRFQGKYSDVGPYFGRIARNFGRYLCGKPLCLYHDGEFKAEDADIEVGFPIRQGQSKDGVTVSELPGGKAVTLIHKGPYDTLSASYQKIFAYTQQNKLQTLIPSREVYLKGPGMILKGNPQNYLTEIQVLVKE